MDPGTMAAAASLFGDISGGSAPSGIGGYDTLATGDSRQHGSQITIGPPPATQQTGLIIGGIVAVALVSILLRK